MKVIGITGGIGSGKSVVSRILRCNDYTVYDCDSEAKRLMIRDNFLKETLIKELGKEIYNKNDELNKSRLSFLLFNNEKTRCFINKNVHEAVRRDIKENIEKRNDIFFIESAIPVTGGIVSFLNEIWIVNAPEQLRIRRVEQRDSLSKEEIELRMRTQQKEFTQLPFEKVKLIENNNMISLIDQIKNLIKDWEKKEIIKEMILL